MAGSAPEVRRGLLMAGVAEADTPRAEALYSRMFEAFEHADDDHTEMALGGGDWTVGLAVLAVATCMAEPEPIPDKGGAVLDVIVIAACLLAIWLLFSWAF